MSDEQLRAAAEAIVKHHDESVAADSYCSGSLALAKAYLAEPANQPAGAEASGCELPTDLQRWLSSVFEIPVTAKQAAMVWASVGRWEPWVPEGECPTVDMLKKLVRFIERDELQFISTGVEFEWLEGLRKRIALIESNWHPAPASDELAELREKLSESEKLSEARNVAFGMINKMIPKLLAGENPWEPPAHLPMEFAGTWHKLEDAVKRMAELRAEVERLREEINCAEEELDEARKDTAVWKSSYNAVLAKARKDSLKAQEAERLEAMLLDIGKLCGCGQIDDALPSHVGHYVREAVKNSAQRGS